MPTEVKVKKVNAYPISAALTTLMGPAQANILKLTLVGFIAEIKTPYLKVGEKLEVSFEIPVTHKQIKQQCVVIKLYNQWRPPEDAKTPQEGANTPAPVDVPGHKPGTVQHLAEIHFKPLTQDARRAINDFLKKINGGILPPKT